MKRSLWRGRESVTDGQAEDEESTLMSGVITNRLLSLRGPFSRAELPLGRKGSRRDSTASHKPVMLNPGGNELVMVGTKKLLPDPPQEHGVIMLLLRRSRSSPLLSAFTSLFLPPLLPLSLF